jgi:gluconolactonase
MSVFAADLGFPEGPVLLPDGSFLCVEMSGDKGCVTHLSAGGKARRVLAKTGRPNGLARDRAGFIWITESVRRVVLKMDADGAYEVFARDCNGEPFLFLNDLAFAPDGDLYVTDSGILVEALLPGGQLIPDWRTTKYDGRVYRIEVATGRIEVIDRGLEFANGIAFGPDGVLHVAETMTGNIYRYPRGRRELFGNVLERYDAAELKGPDGIKFGEDGNLYAAVFGQGDVTVLGRRGEVVRRLKVEGACPTNLAFGPRGARQIYVTEVTTGTIQILDAGTDGAPLHG